MLAAAALLAAEPGVDASALNRSVDPCVDFYQFACGNWIARNPVPADRPRWGRFDELSERNLGLLLEIVKQAAAGASRGALEQRIGDYYASCMDTGAIDAKGLDPIKDELRRINAISDEVGVVEAIGRLHGQGVNVFFRFGARPDQKNSAQMIASISQGGLSLPDREYYLRTDARSTEIRDKFTAHVKKMFELAGESPAAAASRARTLLDFETVLAKAQMDRVSLRDPDKTYNKMTRAEFQALFPDFPVDPYLKQIGAPAFDSLNVSNPDYFKKIGADLPQMQIESFKTYYAWHVLSAAAPRLAAPFEQESFNFNGRVLGGAKEQRPREKRCVEATDRALGDLLGQKYIEKTFGGDSRKRIEELVAAVEASLEKDIRELPWMSETTKQQAVAKLRAITNNVGYAKKWRTYAGVEIGRGDYLGNSQRLQVAEEKRNLGKIGQPTDKTEWRMTPPTVNAFYSPNENSINFPAGILQLPFYSATGDMAANLGGIGAVIGHELTHGFDDQGRKFDRDGNLRDWWTAADGQEFERRVACIADEYSGFSVGDLKVNGKLTLGENTADHGGVTVALMALQEYLKTHPADKVGGFTPAQRLFLSYAQIWCQNVTPEAARMRVMTDPHSPGQYRVNGVAQNLPAFREAFACKAGQPMVSASACRVW
jgi:endothelin-converting enzyme/putative endopeptidase